MSDKPLRSDAEDRAMLQKAKQQILREANAAAAQLGSLSTQSTQAPKPTK